MKKLLIVVLVVLFCAADVSAAPFHHRGHYHRPQIVIRHSHGHHIKPLVVAAAGIIGYAVGSAISSNRPASNNNYVVYENPQKCFVVVSKTTGNINRRCVNGNNDDEVLYVD